jgi:hypothetical protein
MQEDDPSSFTTDDGHVVIADGWRSRTVFTAAVRSDGPPYVCQMDFVAQAGRWFVTDLHFRPDHPMSREQMMLFGRRVGEHIVAACSAELEDPNAVKLTYDSGVMWDSPATYDSGSDPVRAEQIARRAFRRRITPEFLADVADLERKGGMPAILERYPSSERNVRNWLRQAREAGLR